MTGLMDCTAAIRYSDQRQLWAVGCVVENGGGALDASSSRSAMSPKFNFLHSASMPEVQKKAVVECSIQTVPSSHFGLYF